MRTLAAACALAVLSLAALARADDPRSGPPSTPANAVESVWVEFTGVDANEAPAVAKAVGGLDGVTSFEWLAPQTEARLVRAVGKADATALDKAAKSAGADAATVEPVVAKQLTFVKKLHCQGCVLAVNRALKPLAGVKDVTIPDSMDTVTVVYDTRKSKVKDFEDALAAISRPVVTEPAK